MVINLLNIGGAQQVTLEVTVAEVQRTLVRRFDSNFHFFQKSGDFTWGQLPLVVASTILGRF